jgi:hypothetical protein
MLAAQQKRIAIARLKALATLWNAKVEDLSKDYGSNASCQVRWSTDQENWYVKLFLTEDPIRVGIFNFDSFWWIDVNPVLRLDKPSPTHEKPNTQKTQCDAWAKHVSEFVQKQVELKDQERKAADKLFHSVGPRRP